MVARHSWVGFGFLCLVSVACAQILGISERPLSCGNGVIDLGEICDGNCLTSCASDNACAPLVLVGSADTCDVRCVLSDVLPACTDDDQCCPAGCTPTTDNDCSTTCGNGTIESPNETCDGNCPTSCPARTSCESDGVLTGNPEYCSSACHYDAMPCQGGDGCCPVGCTEANDSDCSANTLRLVEGGITSIATTPSTNGTLTLKDGSLEIGGRLCAGNTCVTGGIVP